jgi:hypothetical protein
MTFSPSQDPDVTRIFPSNWRSNTMVALSLVASFSRTFSSLGLDPDPAAVHLDNALFYNPPRKRQRSFPSSTLTMPPARVLAPQSGRSLRRRHHLDRSEFAADDVVIAS